jgi:hypothetical protein
LSVLRNYTYLSRKKLLFFSAVWLSNVYERALTAYILLLLKQEQFQSFAFFFPKTIRVPPINENRGRVKIYKNKNIDFYLFCIYLFNQTMRMFYIEVYKQYITIFMYK